MFSKRVWAREWLWLVGCAPLSFVVLLITGVVSEDPIEGLIGALLVAPLTYLAVGAIRLTLASLATVRQPEIESDQRGGDDEWVAGLRAEYAPRVGQLVDGMQEAVDRLESAKRGLEAEGKSDYERAEAEDWLLRCQDYLQRTENELKELEKEIAERILARESRALRT